MIYLYAQKWSSLTISSIRIFKQKEELFLYAEQEIEADMEARGSHANWNVFTKFSLVYEVSENEPPKSLKKEFKAYLHKERYI